MKLESAIENEDKTTRNSPNCRKEIAVVSDKADVEFLLFYVICNVKILTAKLTFETRRMAFIA